jgi:carbamoyl-phosphate synthase small subunit
VKDLDLGTVTITSQNHGYAIDPATLEGTGARVTQLNLNDGTVEGIEVKEARAFSIQYHPEAAPGPWDAENLYPASRIDAQDGQGRAFLLQIQIGK